MDDKMNEITTLHTMIKSIIKKTSNMKQYEILPQFYGMILGDGSYTCTYSRGSLGIETSHIGTLLAFITPTLVLGSTIMLYTFPRRDNISFSRWKIRCYTYIRDVKQNICSKSKLEIAEQFSHSDKQWFSFNAGLMDSDGAIVISVKRRNRPKPRLYLEPEIIIMDQDRTFLEYICEIWKKYSIYGHVNRHPDNVYRFRITSKSQILKFLKYVTPYMFNIERIGKASLLIPYLETNKDLNLLKNRLQIYYNVMDELRVYTQKLSQVLYKTNKKLLIYKEDGEVIIDILYKNKIQNPNL